MDTKRVELKDGHWAEVRAQTTVADLRYQRMKAHERGFEDSTLDGLAVLKTKIVAWSLGEITDDAVDKLDLSDALALLGAISGTDDDNPNSSSASPNGTRRRKAKSETTAASLPGSG